MKCSKINDWLKNNNLDLSGCQFQYTYQEKIIELSLEQVLDSALERVQYEEQIIKVFDKLRAYYFQKDWWGLKSSSKPEEYLIKEIASYLQDMANHKVFENHNDKTWDELAEAYDMDEDFLKWWAKEKDLSDRQMLCDHDDQAQFSEDGQWYNSVSICMKCLAETNNTLEHNEEIELVYKAWKHQS